MYSVTIEKLQNYYDSNGYDVWVLDEVKFHGFSVLKCEEYNPIGKNEYFSIIYKDGTFYNKNFDDIIKLNASTR